MEIEKTVHIKFTDDELVEFIGDRLVELEDGETWELVSSYIALNDYKFKIVTDKGDSSEEH